MIEIALDINEAMKTTNLHKVCLGSKRLMYPQKQSLLVFARQCHKRGRGNFSSSLVSFVGDISFLILFLICGFL
jgi:hypothetical protein